VSTQSKSKMKSLAVLLLFSMLTSLAIHATTLARLSLDQLAAAADAVARVRCVSAESRWENDSIWTVTTFDVIEMMKGKLPSQVAVHVPGGRVGHLNAAVDGTPKFNSGDEAIVFLQRSPAGEFSVAGWVEGSFHIVRDPRTHRESVTQDSSAFAVFNTATRTFQTEGIHRMPIDQFRARVAAAVTAANTQTQEKAR
jgi:hypothetical protein